MMHSFSEYDDFWKLQQCNVCSFAVAKPPTLDAKSSTKNCVSLTIDQPHCKQHNGDTGYVHGYAIFYYPANQPGNETSMAFSCYQIVCLAPVASTSLGH